MNQKNLNQRIIPLLRLSIFIQILIYLIDFNFQPRRPGQSERVLLFEPSTIIPVILMTLILIALFIPIIQKKISRKSILLILYAQTFITIGSRFLFSLTSNRNFPSPAIGLSRWDTLIFLIIPLIYIAWQYKFTYVIVFCGIVTLTEIIPTILLTRNEWDWYFIAINITSILGRGFILGLIGWIESRLVELQQNQQRQLELSNQKLRKYALTTERLAQSQERNRIARELHDTLAHTLSSVSVQLEAVKALFDLNPGDSKKLLIKSIENTRNGLKETRRTLKDLRSSELESFGLIGAINNVLLSAKERGGFQVNTSLGKDLDSLNDEISHSLFRIVQEAMENIVRHSNAKNVSLTLHLHKNEIVLFISDDGLGFSKRAIKEKDSFGIRGMRERVETLGGVFTINSNPQHGTTIEVVLEKDNDKNNHLR
jgi:signal transduction histidine kinase